MKIHQPLLLSCAFLLAGCSTLDNFAAVGAAQLAAPEPPKAIPPLELRTRLVLPPDIKTVAQAAQYLLEPTGYKLVLSCRYCPTDSAAIATKPISPLGLKSQVTTIERALILVAGSNVRLQIDDDAKIVSYLTFSHEGSL
jgi:hypothetical protein